MKQIFRRLIMLTALFGLFLSPVFSNGTKEAAAKDGEPVVLNRLIIVESGALNPVKFENDQYAQEILKRFNIKLLNDVVLFADMNEYNKRLTLLAAAGDWPEFLHAKKGAFTTSIINTAGQESQLYDFTDDLKDPKRWKYNELFAAGIDFNIDPDTGKIFKLPLKAEGFSTNNPAYTAPNIRVDILEKLGRDFPGTPEEFYSLLVDIKQNIKALDGSEIIPLSLPEGILNGAGWTSYMLFSNWVQNNEWEWNDNTGRWERPVWSNYEGFEKMALFFQRLYAEGLLDRETFIQKNDQLKEKMSVGKVGVSTFPFWDLFPINDNLFKTDPTKKTYYGFMTPFPDPETVDYYKGCAYSNFGYETLSINSKTSREKIDAFWTLQDFAVTEEGTRLQKAGIEGVHYNMVDGIAKRTPDLVEKMKGNSRYLEQMGFVNFWFGVDYKYKYDIEDLSVPPHTRTDRQQMVAITDTNRDQLMWEFTAQAFFVDAGSVEQARDSMLREAQGDIFIKAVTAKTPEDALSIAKTWRDVSVSLGIDEVYAEKLELAGKP